MTVPDVSPPPPQSWGVAGASPPEGCLPGAPGPCSRVLAHTTPSDPHISLFIPQITLTQGCEPALGLKFGKEQGRGQFMPMSDSGWGPRNSLGSHFLCVAHRRPRAQRLACTNCRALTEQGWGLGPFAATLAPGHTSPGATKYRETIGDETQLCMRSWDKFWTKDTKRPKNSNAASEEQGAKAGCPPPSPHTTPHTGPPPKAWADHLCHPSSPTPRYSPTLTPDKELAHPPRHPGNQQGNLLLVLAPLCCSRDPKKALPEFLVWPLINFY